MSTTTARTPPSYRGHWLAGVAYPMRDDPLGTLEKAARVGEVVTMHAFHLPVLFVSGPDALRHILQDNYKNYGKQTQPYALLRDLVGLGLVTSEGELWLRQRRIAQPAFHRERVAAFAEAMVREAEATLARWQPAIAAGTAVDVAHDMTHLTLAVVGATLLGGDTGAIADEAGRRFLEANEVIIGRTRRLVNPPLWLPVAECRRFLAARAALDGIVYDLIAERRRANAPRDDLLSLLLHARDEETGEAMSDRQLRDEVMTMFLAGHETTAVALGWAFYLLAQNPAPMARLRAELREVLGGRAPTFADLDRLPYTRMVVQETLRLYPPVWAGSRNVVADDVLPGGFRVRRGTLLLFSPFVTHRLPSVWAEPEAFRPERWEPERARALPRFAWFPFLGGPRGCIGNHFALMEAQLVLATILQRVAMTLDETHPVVPETLLTLRAKHGIRMHLRPAA